MATQTVEQQAPPKRKGKKYVSGQRARHVDYVVVAAQDGLDPTTGQRVRGTEVLAQFRDHKLDTGQAQRAFRWDDETRERVERYLENTGEYHPQTGHLFGCPDWMKGDGSGVFPDQTVEQSFFKSEAEMAAKLGHAPKKVCTAMKELGDDIVQCGEPVTGEEEFCPSCAALAAANV